MNIESNSEQDPLIDQILPLELPHALFFIDWDGTIIPDDSKDGSIDPAALAGFKEIAQALQAKGIGIGLCSDSPFPQLLAVSQRMGFGDAPIIAENGNVLWYKGKKVVLYSVPNRESMKDQISQQAVKIGLVRVDDSVSPTFGGTRLNFGNKEWAFGANREASISVFGPAEFIAQLGNLGVFPSGISVDSSPEYNYFAIHPGVYQDNKGKTLAKIARLGHDVVMIGNTKSDWVVPETGVKCAFVAGARISPDIAAQAAYISEFPIIGGVTDILKHIALYEN